jgi:hypothetical protein
LEARSPDANGPSTTCSSPACVRGHVHGRRCRTVHKPWAMDCHLLPDAVSIALGASIQDQKVHRYHEYHVPLGGCLPLRHRIDRDRLPSVARRRGCSVGTSRALNRYFLAPTLCATLTNSNPAEPPPHPPMSWDQCLSTLERARQVFRSGTWCCGACIAGMKTKRPVHVPSA